MSNNQMIISRIRNKSLRIVTQRIKMFSSNPKRDEEVEFYSQIDDWWDTGRGKMKTLHKFNRTRMEFVNQMINREFGQENFTGLKMLDIGCGGGILSQSLGRLGGSVTGIDPTPKCIEIAAQHAKKDPQISNRITYLNMTLQELCEKQPQELFDLVCLSEVIEHIDEQQAFLKLACSLVKPGGGFFLSTLNKTGRSFLLGIVMAEYIVGLTPKGTHEWRLFVPPETISKWVENEGFEVKSIQGVVPASVSLKLDLDFKLHPSDTQVNYCHFSTKKVVSQL